MSGYVWRDPARRTRPIRPALAFAPGPLPAKTFQRLTPAERAARRQHQLRIVEALATLHERTYHGPARLAQLEQDARGWWGKR